MGELRAYDWSGTLVIVSILSCGYIFSDRRMKTCISDA